MNQMLQAPLGLAVQSSNFQPEAFQVELMENISAALLRTPSPPCLLRAPTGAGKTYVMGEVLQRVGMQRDVLWFWLVPFVNLVGQTLDSLLQHATDLSPVLYSQGRNQDVGAGTVLISTAQALARAQWRTKGYDADGDDEIRTMAALVARAKAKGLQIGLVVDEAHIGLDKTTELGKFAHWLAADYLLMVTATPKDQRLTDFLAQAGYSGQEHFSVSRDDVVKARLNKRYIESVVYSIGSTMQHLTDLRRTVLRQAWARNVLIGRMLKRYNISCVPLLLVQVGNGEHAVDEAADELMRQCRVPPDAIGRHSADEPDPVMMASIANDSTKQVLIFKQSAGTGFDAPRAFVLASIKPVNDVDFAMQFIGRVMRVARQVRERFPKPHPIPVDLDTAYVYLGNSQAQAGFEAAVQATGSVKNQLEGQTEKLEIRKTVSGAVVYSNRPTPEKSLTYSMGLPSTQTQAGPSRSDESGEVAGAEDDADNQDEYQFLGRDLFSDTAWSLDSVVAGPDEHKPKNANKPRTRDDVLQRMSENRLQIFHRKQNLPTLGKSLKSEEKPSFAGLSAISLKVAQELKISDALCEIAVNAALNRIKETEVHKELTEGASYEQQIAVVTDRGALAREAMSALEKLPHAEEEDYKIIVSTLSKRLRRALEAELAARPSGAPIVEAELVRLARDAAHWVIRGSAQELREAIFQAIADQARVVDAGPLPDVMIFPQSFTLENSSKNIYGVLPPSTDDAREVEAVMFIDERRWWADQVFVLDDGGVFIVGRFDGAVKLNKLEREFSRTLDKSDFVHWWHRNPDKKSYSVRVVRAEHEHYFYPDFVICVSHTPGEAPMQRLLETKDNTKDAARKAQHFPIFYGKVLFLTPDGDRLRWVKDDGSLGEVVKFSEPQSIVEKLRASREATSV
jgi:superfamily II DNA or RNA helicase